MTIRPANPRLYDDPRGVVINKVLIGILVLVRAQMPVLRAIYRSMF